MYTSITNIDDLKAFMYRCLPIIPEDKQRVITLLITRFLLDTGLHIYSKYLLSYKHNTFYIKYGVHQTKGEYILTESIQQYYLGVIQCSLCCYLFTNQPSSTTVTLYSSYHRHDIDCSLCQHCAQLPNASNLLAIKLESCNQLSTDISYYKAMNQLSV